MKTRKLQTVTVGSTVEIQLDRGNEKWRIADEGESDIEAGTISCNAPLAKALLGAEPGETRTYVAGSQEWTVLVCGVSGVSLN